MSLFYSGVCFNCVWEMTGESVCSYIYKLSYVCILMATEIRVIAVCCRTLVDSMAGAVVAADTAVVVAMVVAVVVTEAAAVMVEVVAMAAGGTMMIGVATVAAMAAGEASMARVVTIMDEAEMMTADPAQDPALAVAGAAVEAGAAAGELDSCIGCTRIVRHQVA